MRVLLFLTAAVFAAQLHEKEHANPIRRIVNLLQNMQKEIAAEGVNDKELNEKFVCYCTTNDGELSKGTEELRNKIPEIEASIEESVSAKAQLDQELVQHKADRQAAKESIDSATKQREKEAAAFAEESSELKSNIKAVKGATDAIAKGMAGSFLQSGMANTLRNVVLNREMDRYSRETLTAFLSTSSTTSNSSGEILGILKQLTDDMEKELADATAAENDAITEFEGLVSAKEKEIQAATEAIESKTQRAGETAVQIVGLKNDLEDTKDQLGADEAFLMELKKSCATKGDEFDARQASRAEELVAVSETIKILNDDDALDLFKQTLPSPSLLQTRRERDIRKEAVAALQSEKHNPGFNFITLALEGKKAGFEKIVKMIDDMVVKLGTEGEDDEAQKTWCSSEFDASEDTHKDTTRLIGGLESKIGETQEAITTTADEIEALKQSIKECDDAVAAATEQRHAEHKEFVMTAAQNNAAVQLLGVAKNRMQKFYNPTLYVKPVRRELTEEESIYVNSGGADPRDAEEAAAPKGIGGTGVTVFNQLSLSANAAGAPPPPPETVDAYAKKDSSGPLALLDRLTNDLKKEVQANEMDEKQGQRDYEEMMGESAASRAADSKSLVEKDGQKANLEGDLQAAKGAKNTASKELAALNEYIAKLHGSCDFLLANFDTRKEARAGEIDALKKAKAVLSGADYSFAQVKSFMQRK